jgi:molybdopterin converting factor subunit 1
MLATEMLITVRFFASYADSLGLARTEIALDAGSRVSDVLASISLLPGAQALPNNPRVAVNQVFAHADTLLRSGDEVALIPPVAGG